MKRTNTSDGYHATCFNYIHNDNQVEHDTVLHLKGKDIFFLSEYIYFKFLFSVTFTGLNKYVHTELLALCSFIQQKVFSLLFLQVDG